jgi:hypothetical protein
MNMRKFLKIIGWTTVTVFALAVILTAAIYVALPDQPQIVFPDGATFGFTVFDDSDGATVENIKPVYDYLHSLNIKTTKSVWALPEDGPQHPESKGQTLSNPKYLEFILSLKEKGFEIGYHSARAINSTRETQEKALALFKETIGSYPVVHVNHSANIDNLYWGPDRLNLSILKWIYNLAMPFNKGRYLGHVPDSDYFWGDIAYKHISYVRNFVFKDINTLKINPSMPYYDTDKPYVRLWFSSADGHNADAFNDLLKPDNLDRLEQEGGVCIVYTHFAYGFIDKNRELNAETKERLQDLASRKGCFVPVSQMLDLLKKQTGKDDSIPWSEKWHIQSKWIWEKMSYGSY